MSELKLQIITPRRVIVTASVESVSAPTLQGEITILPRHTNLFSLLNEGIVKIKTKGEEDYLAIGGGFLETNGVELNILVSRAYKQDEIDRQLTEKAVERAKKTLGESKSEIERHEASALLRRSLINLRLIKKRRRPPRLARS